MNLTRKRKQQKRHLQKTRNGQEKLFNSSTNLTHSVPARISKGQGAGPEKGLFSVLLDFQKRRQKQSFKL
jgi:hypothetical protein